MRGFYRGCGTNLLRTTPAAALTFTSFELIARWLKSAGEARQAEAEAAEEAAEEAAHQAEQAASAATAHAASKQQASKGGRKH
jgi:hypothetical protein